MSAVERLKALVLKTKDYVAQQRKLHPGARVLTEKRLKSELPAVLAQLVSPGMMAAQAKPAVAAEAHPKQPWAPSLEKFRAQICGCLNCPLGGSRTRFMFGEGDPKAKLVFFGLTPTADEEATGHFFTGEAGKLLTKMITAMGLKREEIYLMNALKCRLPHDRKQTAQEELEACRPYFEHQLSLISPKVVCALGPEATLAMLGPEIDFAQSRGKFLESKGWLVMPTFHPVELLRHESLKRQAWEDLKALLKKIS